MHQPARLFYALVGALGGLMIVLGYLCLDSGPGEATRSRAPVEAAARTATLTDWHRPEWGFDFGRISSLPPDRSAVILQAAGIPAALRRGILRAQLLRARQEELGSLISLGKNYWEYAAFRPNAPDLARLIDLQKALDESFFDLLGPDALTEAQALKAQQKYPYLGEQRAAALQYRLDSLDAIVALGLVDRLAGGRELGDFLSAITKLKEAAMDAIMTPEERREHRIRNGITPAGSGLVSSLRGFQPTEEEYRAIVELELSFAERMGLQVDPRLARTADPRVREQMKTILGERRFADYEQAQLPRFNSLWPLASRLGLGRSEVADILEIESDILGRAHPYYDVSTYSTAQRETALHELREEALKRLSRALGSRGLEAYRQIPTAGAWLINLRDVNGGIAPVRNSTSGGIP